MDLPTKDAYNSLNLLYDISRELVSALDLATVLQRVLSRSLEIVEANNASIIILNENKEPVDAAIIVDGEVHEGTVDRLKSTLDTGLAGWVVRHQQSAIVANTSTDERWAQRGYDDDYQAAPKSSLCAPLIARGQLVGVITFTHQTPNHYDQPQLNLVQTIADQAAIASLNAQLYEASQRRANVMTLLAETAATITSTLDLDEVFSRILESTAQSLQVEVVLLGLVDPRTKEVVLEAVWGQFPQSIGHRQNPNQGVAGWVASHGETVVVPDITKENRFNIDSELSENSPVRAIAASPISAEGEVVGVLEVINPQEDFSPDNILLLKGISSLAGTAIQHARLFNEVQVAHGRYRQLFEDSIDLLFLTDWDGKILEANLEAVELSGYTYEDLCGMKIFHIASTDWSIVGADFANLKDGGRLMYESQLQPKTGASFPVEVHVHQVSLQEQSGLQWILHDISELKRLERMREDLTSMIYHDLRSPLANVVSGLDLIRSMVPDEYGIESVIQIADRSVNRVQRLVSSLLDTSRLQAGQKILDSSLVTAQDLLSDALEAIKPAADASNFVIDVNQPDTPMTMLIDADMIRRVMINLLENAVKYSAQGKRVKITLAEKDKKLHFSVIDEGRGISPQDQEIIFERFMRGDQIAKNTKGMGLGLAFCKLAVEAHGGEIWVESQLGEGSTFTFEIPINS